MAYRCGLLTTHYLGWSSKYLTWQFWVIFFGGWWSHDKLPPLSSERLDEPSERLDEPSERLDEPSEKLDEPSERLDEPSERLDKHFYHGTWMINRNAQNVWKIFLLAPKNPQLIVLLNSEISSHRSPINLTYSNIYIYIAHFWWFPYKHGEKTANSLAA